MTRLLLFAQRPFHLSAAEADRWIRREAAALTSASAVVRVEFCELESAALRWGREWDWLIELHCDATEDAQKAARDDVCAGLLADLRLLGMRPSLVVAHAPERLER